MSEINDKADLKAFVDKMFSLLGDADYIPEFVTDNVPSLLRDSCKVFNDRRERDVYLTGALTALGGCFHNVYAYNEVDHKTVSPNLVAFIIAPPASGKRALEYSKKVIYGIRDTFKGKSKRKLIIPANNSASGLLQILHENNGAGVMIESEIDTLLNAQKQEWGKNSDIIRNSFDNESYSMYRKMDKEYIEIDKPKLAIALSGTNNQFRELMKSPENGLFSRGCYYVFDDNEPVLKSFGRLNTEVNIDEQFASFAKIANDYYEQLLAFETVQINFSDIQMEKIQAVLQKIYDFILTESKDLKANVKRAFLIALKISTIIEALKRCEEKTLEEINKCSNSSFETGLLLAITYLSDSDIALNLLPVGNKINPQSDNYTRLFSSLPDMFLKAEVFDKAIELGMSKRTGYNAFNYFKNNNWIELQEDNYYQKVK